MSDSLSSICVQCEDDCSQTKACIFCVFTELPVVRFQVHFCVKTESVLKHSLLNRWQEANLIYLHELQTTKFS